MLTVMKNILPDNVSYTFIVLLISLLENYDGRIISYFESKFHISFVVVFIQYICFTRV